MDLDAETMARFLGAICRQAIRDYRDGWHEPGYPDAAEFLWQAGLLHVDGSIGPPEHEMPPGPLPRKLRQRGTHHPADHVQHQPAACPTRKPNDR